MRSRVNLAAGGRRDAMELGLLVALGTLVLMATGLMLSIFMAGFTVGSKR